MRDALNGAGRHRVRALGRYCITWALRADGADDDLALSSPLLLYSSR
jgi:hypothetical protein